MIGLLSVESSTTSDLPRPVTFQIQSQFAFPLSSRIFRTRLVSADSVQNYLSPRRLSIIRKEGVPTILCLLFLKELLKSALFWRWRQFGNTTAFHKGSTHHMKGGDP
jgi:hypothetical protein